MDIDLGFARVVFGGKKVEKPRRWKGTYELTLAINKLMDGSVLFPGYEIATEQVEQIVRHAKLDRLWNVNPDAADDLGLRRSIGDALGKHGLNLRRKGKLFVIPDRMPEVNTNGEVIKEAVYN